MSNFYEDSFAGVGDFVNFETPVAAAANTNANVPKRILSNPRRQQLFPPASAGIYGIANIPKTVTPNRPRQQPMLARASAETPKIPKVVVSNRLRPLFPTKSQLSDNVQTPAGQQQEKKSQAQIPKTPLVVKPGGKNFIDFKLDANDVVCFFGREHFLSNFFMHPFEDQNNRYYSVEHYYEAVKLHSLFGAGGAAQLVNVKDACAAKSISRRLIAESGIDRLVVENWRRRAGITVVMNALAIKFAPGTDMARQLLATGTALLAQANPHDDLWAVNLNETQFMEWAKRNDQKAMRLPTDISPNTVNALPIIGRNGKNMLGFILMQIRRSLQHQVRQMPVIEEKEDENAAGTSNSDTVVSSEPIVTDNPTIVEQQPTIPNEPMVVDEKSDAKPGASTENVELVTGVIERCNQIGSQLAQMNMRQQLDRPKDQQQQPGDTTNTTVNIIID